MDNGYSNTSEPGLDLYPSLSQVKTYFKTPDANEGQQILSSLNILK